MITATELERLRALCGCGVAIAEDVAEYLEGRANWAWDSADLFGDEAANEGAVAVAANQSGAPAQRPRWTLEALATALRVRLVEESLPGLIVGAYVRAQGLILIERGLREEQRSPVVSHECSHGTLHAHAPHDEVSYLALCYLFPMRLLRSLPERRTQVSARWLTRAVPYRAPLWAAEYRAPILQRALDAGRF
jgi:hypothetical protein